MSRSNGRGRGRGGRDSNDNSGRGRGGGRGGRGFRGGRGRGRGGAPPFPRGDYDISDNGMDFVVQQWPQPNDGMRGAWGGRGRGRGSGGPNTPNRSGANTPRGRGGPPSSRGTDSFRGRAQYERGRPGFGRGGGRGRSKLMPNAPLSRVLAEDRPYLRPVIFVRSEQTPFLFRVEEEIFRPVAEEVGDGEISHVPTADKVFRVFHGLADDSGDNDQSTDGQDDVIEEIDFADLGRIQAEVTAAVARGERKKQTGKDTDIAAVEERFTGIKISSITVNDPAPATPGSTAPQPEVESVQDVQMENTEMSEMFMEATTTEIETAQETPIADLTQKYEPAGFYIDTNPTQPPAADVANALHSSQASNDLNDDDDIIVYVAPHPRTSSASHPPADTFELPPLPTTSILTGLALGAPPLETEKTLAASQMEPDETTPAPTIVPGESDPAPAIPEPPSFESVKFNFAESPAPKKAVRQAPIFVVGSRTKAKAKARVAEKRRKSTQRSVFGSFGARLEDAQWNDGPDPRWEERRRGDSDLEWGEEDEGGDGLAEGMSLDPDLQFDVDAMRSFVKGMAPGDANFVTMDDIADQIKIAEEDAAADERGSESGESEDDELDAMIHAEEGKMIAEDEDEDMLSSDDDLGLSPNASFQARLHRLRQAAQGKPRDDFTAQGLDDLEEEDDDENDLLDDAIAHIQALLDDNRGILEGRNRKRRKGLFNAIHRGDFDIYETLNQPSNKKDRYDDLQAHLQEQWEKDRARKAENKRLRALARLELAADPLAICKGGKKGKKAMLAAARLDPTITVLPNRVIDMTTLVQQVRRFIADLNGPQSMSLPPTDKTTRKKIHEMALAFGLKSLSKGKRNSRYTTLTKTTRTGIMVDENKIARIVRRGTSRGEFVASGGRSRGGRPGLHRDGDTVGKEAPKIGEENIGFRMLASMGWSEGNTIGFSGGLDEPLTAVIKKTKLGLGATR